MRWFYLSLLLVILSIAAVVSASWPVKASKEINKSVTGYYPPPLPPPGLHGCSRDGNLFRINLTTGAGTLVGHLPFLATEIVYNKIDNRAFFQTLDGGFVGQEFDMNTGAGIGLPVDNGGADNGLEWVGAALYGTAIFAQRGPSELRTLDPYTGVSALVGPTGLGPIAGLTRDPAIGVMYGITGGAAGGAYSLVTASISTGAATVIGSVGFNSGSLEFGPDGNLYAGATAGPVDGNLYCINKVTGASTLVGPTGFISVTGLTLGPVPPCTVNPIVANNADSGPGSLRQAVIDACAGSTITFAGTVAGPILLSGGEIGIFKNLTINGPGANILTVQNTKAPDIGANSRVFSTGANVTLNGLTITGGNVQLIQGGGGPSPGGGILNHGTLNVTNSTIAGNRTCGGGGGGISQEGLMATVTVINSTISGNIAATCLFAGSGGGIYNLSGTVNVTNSTISGNQASGSGGGIYNLLGTVNVTNSTISGNQAPASGSVGGGIANFGTANSRNSIVAGNTVSTDGPDFYGTPLTSQGYNLIGNTSFASIVGDLTGNVLNQNPQLGPLANNGGPTQTHALLTGSPAINAGSNALALDPNNQPLTTDQRGTGFPRIFGVTVDIGAFEDSCNPDTTPPLIVCPGGITRFSDPGQSNASISPGTPVATDNCAMPSVTGARSDGKALTAPYPFGVVTLITWTATDTNGNRASCVQSIAVMVPSGQRRKP